ncbi:MAG: hypothetical protein DMG32_12295 [Acidobacteria bacterium]|nr:MAG: hypothetical protein DMG32_12295 [Acidobacteriota bacterium]
MCLRIRYLLIALAAMGLAAPAWASRVATDISIDRPTQVVGTSLKAGTYHVVASDESNSVTFLQNNKVVAEVPAHWTKLDRKAEYSAFITNGDQIQQIQFAGKDMAISLGQ